MLGAINDWQWRIDLSAAEARYQESLLTMENDLARGSAQAGADRANAEYLRSEVAQARSRLDSAQLRSPIAGIVVTPNLQNLAGQHLDAGAAFAQVLDLESAVIQVAVPEQNASLLGAGQDAAIKLESYPQRTWHSQVSMVSPQAVAGDGFRTFYRRSPGAEQRRDASCRNERKGEKSICGLRPAGLRAAAPAGSVGVADGLEPDRLVTHAY